MALPEGPRGRMLALAITILGLGLVWLALGAPLLGWYQARAVALSEARMRAAHLARLAAEVPALRRAVLRLGGEGADRGLLLPGASDALAGANLQSELQDLAAQAGVTLDSAAMQPAAAAGALRRITVQVSLSAPFAPLVVFLGSIGTARPQMILDDLSLTAIRPPGGSAPPLVIEGGNPAAARDAGSSPPPAPTIEASFSVTGFRAGDRP